MLELPTKNRRVSTTYHDSHYGKTTLREVCETELWGDRLVIGPTIYSVISLNYTLKGGVMRLRCTAHDGESALKITISEDISKN